MKMIRQKSVATSSPLPPCGGARSRRARAEGGDARAEQDESCVSTPLPIPPPQGGREEYVAPLSRDRGNQEPFGVYVHWPFCLAKCPYCDFNSHVRHGGVDQDKFLAGYLAELRHFASLAPRRHVAS